MCVRGTSMARTPQDVTLAELKVLELLWERGPITVRQITDTLYPDGGVSKYATVQKLLERLGEAEFVVRDRSGGGQSCCSPLGPAALHVCPPHHPARARAG